ncbi:MULTISPECIES: bifunctional folylpolyglutamate synthase/dihydrofolate synthase [Rhodobacterales]|jgi:dihydrofolate synthase/folylpolyglutamate synthase|uniref:bifunctional folylpolyglutamate synthase/dihydrofolate synthase n=1 Tax=Rhodobacterales TaxID=204455 RepID=UPI00237F6677|nr:folylpolyglutamate synthase/dihydrofolate synthase family protein [Phaeobacter gallaeciensis]MDE4141846.1 bifunctional folylpolyglutamate synthase/dihydrofolate synthase [Phaeobacter gallaeciensis]MDE4150206.1 bifunctional folylpolyglutamate synthase/dihydrofolate synthase [Phaeobacter gallaeciensis]MDE4154517.1 bifunctional folylpolyglutamate synthase/dihydrofolate synthase [Phaeobacter gallaeciensis]MDE4229823.1 bifunctional folylpolyglutamate synthase/dihydrofolate synthase [Phaeobacter g
MTKASSDAILDRMMALHPKIIDLTLDRVWRLLAALDNPQDRLPPVIHIAGTNGKGSTQAMIRAGLEGAGKSVHAYTSPHLARFHERIRLAGELISEAHLTEVLDECYAKNGGENITYFEITTCAALQAFARTPADYTLLEVGLGGRLDATNVIEKPALSVITPVSIDHEQFLGNTLAKIAGEKAGIIKRGVPVVVGPQDDEAMEVIEDVAARLGAPLIAHGQHWHVYEERGRLIFQDEAGLLDLPMPALIGAHQVQNAGMALAVLRHLGADEVACEAAMARAEWSARMQRLKTGLLVEAAAGAELWLDGGHNAAAGHALADVLAGLPKRPTHLICGMLNTKDVTGYMAPLAPHVESLTAISIPGEAATLSAEETETAAQSVGITATRAEDALSALQAIIAKDPSARVLICGSLYLAGHILRENG